MSSTARTGRGSMSSTLPSSLHCDLCATRSAARGPGGMVFAKNSDRPPGEVQVAWPFGRRSSNGCTLRTQYLTIGDTGAHAVLLSCPTWLWGAEHGVNEYGVAIGNERVGTTHDAAGAKPALIGMDLVRLGLGAVPQRGRGRRRDDRTARVLRAGRDHRRGPRGGVRLLLPGGRPPEAFVLETAGTDYAVAPARGAAAISNRLDIGTEWTRASSAVAPGTAFTQFRDSRGGHDVHAEVRLAASRRFLDSTPPGGLTARATAAHLRDHGTRPVGSPGRTRDRSHPPPSRVGEDFAGVTVCMHVRDLSVTAASMIAELPDGLGDGCAPARLRGAREPVRQHLRPRLSPQHEGPATVRADRALGRGALARRRRRAPAGRNGARSPVVGAGGRCSRWRTRSGSRRTRCSSTPTAGLRSPVRGAPAALQALTSCIP